MKQPKAWLYAAPGMADVTLIGVPRRVRLEVRPTIHRQPVLHACDLHGMHGATKLVKCVSVPALGHTESEPWCLSLKKE